MQNTQKPEQKGKQQQQGGTQQQNKQQQQGGNQKQGNQQQQQENLKKQGQQSGLEQPQEKYPREPGMRRQTSRDEEESE